MSYSDSDEIHRVGWAGELRFRGHKYRLSTALMHYNVAVRARPEADGLFDVFFAHHRCLRIDLRDTAQSK